MKKEKNTHKTLRRYRIVLWTLVVLLLITTAYAAKRFLSDQPVVYSDPVEHFKYGSTGGERNLGFPYWIWRSPAGGVRRPSARRRISDRSA